jgi:hypothetical protein
MTTSVASPQAVGTLVTLNAAAAGCGSPSYQFWMQPPGGGWQVLQAYSSNASVAWDTTSLAEGTYLFDVWAREDGSTAQYESHISPNPTFTLASPACRGVTLSAGADSPQLAGTTVRLSAAASGCSNPEFQFLVQTPGGGWTALGPYSSSASVDWDTSSLTAGIYQLDVNARQSGSQAVRDTHLDPTVPYVLFAEVCTSIAVDGPDKLPQKQGTQVPFAATATGCAHPRFQYLLEAVTQPWWNSPPAWSVVQDYSSNSGWVWDTSSSQDGFYLVDVKVRGLGSTADADAELDVPLLYLVTNGQINESDWTAGR